jgi:hypothetical protein
MKMHMEFSRRIEGVRLLLRKPFPELMNEENMKRLTEDDEG